MKLKLFFVLLALFGLNCGHYNSFTAYYNTYYNAKNEFEAGVQEILKNQGKPLNSAQVKHFQNAIDKCWRIIEFHGYENAWSDDAILLIAKCEFYLNKIESARQHIKLFRDKYGTSPLLNYVNFWEAKCELADKDTVAALNMMDKNLLLAKDKKLRSDIFLEQARIFFSQKKYEQSVTHYEKALKEASDKLQKANIQFYLAESYYNSRQWENAAKVYKKVMEFTPTLQVEFLTQFHYAVSVYKMGKIKKAVDYLERMLTASRFKPFYPEIYAQLGDIYRDQEDYESMRYYYREGIKLRSGEGRDRANYAMASAFEELYNQVDSAIFYYKEAQKLGRNTEYGKKAEHKAKFLNELSQIKRRVEYEYKLIDRLQHDPAFRDSLEDARRIQQMFDKNRDRAILPPKQLLYKLAKKDTERVFFTKAFYRISRQLNYDSLRFIRKIDSLEQDFKKDTLVFLDTLKYPKKDSIAAVYFDYQSKVRLFEKSKKHQVESRSVTEVKEDLKKHLLELGDFYLFETGQVDSARKIYGSFIQTYNDSLLVPRALYALAYIKKNYDKDETGQRQLIKVLLSQYPNSIYAKRYREQVSGKSEISRWESLYNKAEKKLLEGAVDSALTSFKTIYQHSDSANAYKPKSLFAVAWIYENELHRPDSALFYYKKIDSLYKNTPYGKRAMVKLQVTRTTVKKATEQLAMKQTRTGTESIQSEESPYTDADLKRIKERINNILQEDYLSDLQSGEMKRYWSKTQLRDFISKL